MPGAYGSQGFGSSPYGSAMVPFGVAEAVSLSPTWVRVRFTDLIDPADPVFALPANYSLSPALQVKAAFREGAQSVRILTETQSAVTYTLTVAAGRSVYGDPIDLRLHSVDFDGLGANATFFAVPIRQDRVRLVFSQRMSPAPATLDPANYQILNAQTGDISVIDEVTPEYNGVELVSVVLELAAALQITGVYQAKVEAAVRSYYNTSVFPDTSKFQWVQPTGQLVVPMAAFSGELHGGPLGSRLGLHNGLIYFSPALEAAAANSIIEVDECSVCTKAYDEYHLPVPPDPKVLYTFGPGQLTTLGAGAVLWAAPPRICEARTVLQDLRQEAMPQAADSHCVATFREPWDHSHVALLNNTYWKLFDGGASPPMPFITANNIAGPIPPGPTTTRVLQPPP